MTPAALPPRRAWATAVVDKWYLDALMEDGGVLVVVFVRLRFLGVPVAWVAADLRAADGTARRGFAFARRARESEGGLRFGPARIEGPHVSWTTPGLSGDLDMVPRHPAAVLCDPVFMDREQLLRWWVEVPDADVQGRLRWPGGSCAVRGRGYRDRVLARAVPWRFPVRRLRWGHAVSAHRAAVWFEAQTTERVLRAGWEDGHVSEGPVALAGLDAERLLLDERAGERLAGRATGLRRACRRLTSDPHQTRWAAAARLGAEEGRAVFEYVQWG